MRELMNCLPSVITDTSIPRPNPSASRQTADLPRLRDEHPEMDLLADQDVVPVPRAFAEALDQLISTVVRENGRNRRIAAELVTGGQDGKHPAVEQWRRAQDFFLGWAHIDRNHEGGKELPSDADLLANIKVVEDILEVRTAAFFENVKSLEGMLAQINAPIEEDL
ncbi:MULTISPECIES: hypothetical protein [unclassified Mycobacterium]|uniref:hypothetical protein n=1 Tax=unclassified Mycobacterium TaxID=2642494 RepID=UPI0029C7A880|nr:MULTISPECIES: hypothetical protein [unclassified Mycobacterium]